MEAQTAPARAAQMEPDHDSFDEDFEWIIERLLDRVGGTFGILVRHSAEDAEITVLARTGRAAELQQQSLKLIARSVKDLSSPVSSGEPSRLEQQEISIPEDQLGAVPLRVLSLSFSPCDDVELTVLVCRLKDRRRFGLVAQHAAKRLYPVFARYLRLWWLHREERRRCGALRFAVELTGSSLIVLDRKARINFCSSKARSLLGRQEGLYRQGKVLRATDREDTVRLHAAVQMALEKNSASLPSSSNATSVLTIKRGTSDRNLVLLIAGVERLAVVPEDPAVMISIVDPEQHVAPHFSLLRSLYGLTTAEAKLAAHLVNGLTLTEGAEQMVIRPDTARAYLKQIFVKTMTNRQSELIRLLLISLSSVNASTN